MEGMVFVYSLCSEGNIFYIGYTKNLAKRYQDHLSGNACCHSFNTIKQLKNDGKLIEMKVLYFLPIIEAKKKEIELIKLFTSAGLNLSNDMCNEYGKNYGWKWSKLPNNITNKTMPLYLCMLQKIKEYYYKFYLDHTDAEFPDKELKILYE